jgi:apolipoprotein N-acyltransferase
LNRFINLYLAIASGLLLWIAWPVSQLTLLIFVAFLPLLWMEERVTSRKKFFWLIYVAMVIWNVSTTWWIWNASAPGAVGAFLLNSLLMCLPWLGFTIVKKSLGKPIGYLSLIAFWMCFEYIHLQDWGLSWPWLTLGNVFATHTGWIQWYEYTGTSGGTLWILLVNILLFIHVRKNSNPQEGRSYKYLIPVILLLALPLIVSRLTPVDESYSSSGPNIVVVQPNVDPYTKISDAAGSFEGQLQQLIHLSEKEIDADTRLVVWPETAMYTSGGIDEANMKKNFFLNPLWGFLQRHPQIILFTGVESYRSFDGKQTKTARPMGDGTFYDAYNGSVLLDSAGAFAFYHKSMLVPGVETLPWFLRFIDSWFEKFGGTTAGYARQQERTVLDTKKGYRIAPSICYESIYGDFMRRYIRNGANLICIITNDGWWKNTPGHKQHMNYARLRAIETRTWIARSANTGISCFIDPYGTVISPQPYDTKAVIKLSIPVTAQQPTLYVRIGDILSIIMLIASIGLIGWVLVRWIMKKRAPRTATQKTT